MITPELVDLSRLQFAVTALYHYLFVPLTLGLYMILVAKEGCYVVTGKEIYKDMTRFWGKLFAINFAMGVATGITMEFQFGTNWAYYSHYVEAAEPPGALGLHVPHGSRYQYFRHVDSDRQRLDAVPEGLRLQR